MDVRMNVNFEPRMGMGGGDGVGWGWLGSGVRSTATVGGS
jgi:hypothetical protein